MFNLQTPANSTDRVSDGVLLPRTLVTWFMDKHET